LYHFLKIENEKGSYTDHKILVFSPSFELKFSLGEGTLECWGITMDTEGNYIVTEVKSNSVIIFDPEGKLDVFLG
jgi:sugar lactone lactonase YvrE